MRDCIKFKVRGTIALIVDSRNRVSDIKGKFSFEKIHIDITSL